MKTIAILNQKGGVGKTASATTLADILATIHHKKVLLIDVDPQANTSSLFDDVDYFDLFVARLTGVATERKLSIEDLLLDADMNIRKCIQPSGRQNLFFIPTYQTLAETEERLKADVKSPQQMRLKYHLEEIADEYDYCIIDCSPSISILNINALAAADEVYIPTRADGMSIYGVAIAISLVKTVQAYNRKLKLMGCFFAQCDTRTKIYNECIEFLDTVVPGMRLPYIIGKTVKLEENSWMHKTLLDIDPNNKVAIQYCDFAQFIVSDNREKTLEKYYKKIKMEEEIKNKRKGKK